MEKFSLITVLVIEARQAVRTQIRAMLDGVSISQVQFASNAYSAIRKLQIEPVDLILCSHNLGEGQQDGQHLLEDLRTNTLIGRQTLFFILSDTPRQQQVVGTADLSPDGFLVKPFSPHLLQTRLAHALRRREHFMPLYRAIQEGRSELALDYCLHAEERFPRYRNDFIRERAEILLADGQYQEAHDLFADIAATADPVPPWAELGVVRCLIALKQLDEARTQLTGLLAKYPLFLAANDCLTQIFEAQGDLHAARQSLETILELAPNRTHRLRAHAMMSLQLKDRAAAEETLNKIIDNNRFSIFRDPQDHLRMINVLLADARIKEADGFLLELERDFGEAPLHVLCRDLARGRIAGARKEKDDAHSFTLHAYNHLQQVGLETLANSLNNDTLKDMTGQLLDNKLEEEACELSRERIRTAANQRDLASARAALRELGRKDLAEKVEIRLQDAAQKYLDRSEELEKAGQFEEAVLVLMQATNALPGSPRLLVNAAIALIRSLREQGWVLETADRALGLLARARQIEPENGQAQQLTRYLKQLAREKKGDAAAAFSAPQDTAAANAQQQQQPGA